MKTTTKKTLRSLLTLAVGVAALSLPGWVQAQDPGPAVGIYAGRLPFWGSFPNDSHLTNGFLCLKVSARKAVTGTVQVAGRTHRLPRGVVLGGDGTTGVVTLVNPRGVAYPVTLQITSSDEDHVGGQVIVDGGDPLVFQDGHALSPRPKYSRTNPFPFAGLGSAGMEQFETEWVTETEVDPDTGEVIYVYSYDEWPMEGMNRHGYALIKISNAGIATYKGQLPDGTKFRGSTCAQTFSWGGPEMLDLWIYAVTNRGAGSVVGGLGNYEMHGMMDPDAPTLFSGDLRWYPDPTTTPGKRTWLAVEGSEYTPPVEGERIVGGGDLAANLLQDPAAALNSPAGINALLSGPLGGAPNTSLRPVPPYPADLTGAGAPSAVTIYFKPKDGSFKYVFIHPGTLRKTTGYGAVVQHATEWVDMGGFFEPVIVPGFGSGVFLNKLRNPDGSTTVYPGWMVFDPQLVP